MTDSLSFRTVIELWETREALAFELPGVTSSQVSKWWQRNKIPAEHWTSLLKTERSRSFGLSADSLATLAAKDIEEARA